VKTDLSEIIADNFGANATYVEGLLARWQSDPALVDEAWRAYFEALLSDGETSVSAKTGRTVTLPQADGSGTPTAQPDSNRSSSGDGTGVAPAGAPSSAAKPQPEAPAEPESKSQATPIRGAALKIVENMEASLAVPTATSQRRIPVKLLDENRRVINRHLQENDRGKASYTHLIAWAIVRALEEFPQLNNGFEVVEEQPSRVKRD
jgi:2-oxoglutarate decarboxylase